VAGCQLGRGRMTRMPLGQGEFSRLAAAGSSGDGLGGLVRQRQLAWIQRTGRLLVVSGRIGTSRTLSHGRQLNRNAKDRLHRYRTEGEEKSLKICVCRISTVY
jgi:hypothetical protein